MKLKSSLFYISIFFLLVSCVSDSKRLEGDLEKAQKFFEPLQDYSSVSCDVRLHLPESFKARKKVELKTPAEQKVWNDVFTAVEEKVFNYSSSMGRCWVRGMKPLKDRLSAKRSKDEPQHIKFLSSLEAQVQVGNCVLVQALFYNSPLQGLRYDRYSLKANAERDGFALVANNGKSQINWSPESKTLTSHGSNGEVFMGSYEGEGHNLKMKRASILSASHSLSIEDIKYELSPKERLLVSEYILSLEENEGNLIPQARVSMNNCVSRIRSAQPLNRDEQKED